MKRVGNEVRSIFLKILAIVVAAEFFETGVHKLVGEPEGMAGILSGVILVSFFSAPLFYFFVIRPYRKSAEQRVSLINNLPGVVYRGHRDWSVSFMGAQVEQVTGYAAGEFLDGTIRWKDRIHPSDLDSLKRVFRETAEARKKVLRVEYRALHKDGSYRWIADRRQFVYDAQGNFRYVDGILLDITDRKRAEEAALQERDFTLAALDSLPGLFYLFDEQGRFLRWNKNFEKASGYSAEEIPRMSPLNFFSEPDKEIIAEKIRQVFLTGEASAEGDFLSKDQTKTPCFFTGKLFIFEQKCCLIGMGIDIAVRRRAEEALRKSEMEYHELSTEFHAILDVIPDNITRLSPDLNVIWANRATVTSLKRELPGLAGCHCYTLRHNLDRPYDNCPVLRTFRTGEPDYEIIQDSDNKTLEVRTVPVKEEGRVTNVIEIIRDITERRKLERQIQTAQKMESVGTLAGGIAHDFNNALTGIIGFGEMVKLRIANDPKALSDLDEVFRCAERASVLTRQLLAFARRQVIDPVNLDLNEVVSGLVKLLRKVTRANIEIKPLLAEGVPTIRADQGQVEQVLMNLSLNARDAMPGGGQLVVETQEAWLDEEYVKQYPYVKAGRYAVLSVSDTGIGMDEATRERIFEPFFTTKGPDKGTGLGLAMVYGIVKQHDGFIHVYSEPGKGTTFRVYFPEVDAPADAKVVASQGVARGGCETILLAEDDESVRHLMEQTLISYGYRVLIACDGEEAVGIFRREGKEIAMAVLDVVMPKKGGKQAYDEMIKTFPGLKVLFLSGYSANAIHDDFVLHPGIPFLQKPFDLPSLARKVREVLDGK
jgi:PAS domain S-box-containing protein